MKMLLVVAMILVFAGAARAQQAGQSEEEMALARIKSAKTPKPVSHDQCRADLASWDARDAADDKAKVSSPDYWYQELSTEELLRLQTECVACLPQVKDDTSRSEYLTWARWARAFGFVLQYRAERILIQHDLVHEYILVLASGVVTAQTGTQSNYALLDEKAKRFLDYDRDFLDFTKSSSSSRDEYEIASELYTVSSEMADRLDAALTLIDIYDDLSCEEDRKRVHRAVEHKFRYYSNQTDSSITTTNHQITYTKIPAVAAEGTRMRDDLREIKSILDSIKFR